MGCAMRPPRKPTGGKRPASPSDPKTGQRSPVRSGSHSGQRPPGAPPLSRRDQRAAGWSDRRERAETNERPPRGDRPQRDDRSPRPARSERPQRAERPDRAEGPPRGARPDLRDRPARTERAQRGERPARPAAGPGKPAPRAEQPRIRRGPAPVRQTEVAAQRIAKALARAGVGSRRDIERMIAEGRIAIDGEVLTSPALNITNLANVTVDGEPVAGIAPAKLYRFHKPAGFLTAARDPAGRPTIMDILPPSLPRVVPVGRLDMNTEGLLLLTTDGELKRALELPSSGVPRVYRVRAFGEVTQKVLEALADGISIEGVHYGPILADIERKTGHNLWLIVTIREGKNREVRRVLEHVGLQVNRLIRVAYGPIGLDDLPPRMADEIPDSDVALLKAMLKATKTEPR
ncbi:pseudouridine synthase [Sandarakinorhabdus limnophila]|uniref:pseudouridine synthase n=1 Tax=Sandarakinorhabdus limnophila TaxID=210512 RepID=UPI0026F12B37|nr:pseudouridine synthase [Sandarakinorhabdus limnophila]